MSRRRNLLLMAGQNLYGKYKIFGKSFKYNNLVQNGNFESVSWWNKDGGVSYTVENNVATITSTLGEYAIWRDLGKATKWLQLVWLKAEEGYCILEYSGQRIENDGEWHLSYYFTPAYLSAIAIRTNGVCKAKKCMSIDLTDLFGAGNEPTTLDQFYATDLGKAIQNGFIPSYTGTNGSLLNATSPFSCYKGNTKVGEINFATPIELRSAGTIKDTYTNIDGIVERKVGSVDLGNYIFYQWSTSNVWYTYGIVEPKANQTNELCSKYPVIDIGGTSLNQFGITMRGGSGKNVWVYDDNFTGKTAQEVKALLNGVILNYELATYTTENLKSQWLPKGITKITDANGVEMEFSESSTSIYINRLLQGKNSPTINAELVITEGFTSGDEHFTQMYIYDDGEIWYVNAGGSVQAYASGIWETEYKTIEFDKNATLNETERATLLNIYNVL